MTEEEIKQKGIKYATEYPAFQELGYERLGYKRKDLRKSFIAGTKLMQEDINKLLDVINNQDVKIADLEKKVNEYEYLGIKELQSEAERLAKGNNYLTNQLEQAKGLLKEFMRISVASVEEYEPEFSELVEQAEQFIKDLEK